LEGKGSKGRDEKQALRGSFFTTVKYRPQTEIPVGKMRTSREHCWGKRDKTPGLGVKRISGFEERCGKGEKAGLQGSGNKKIN